MSASGWVHIDVERIKKITEKAMLVTLEDGDLWIPLSQVDEPDNFEEGDEDITVSVTEWFSKKQELSE